MKNVLTIAGSDCSGGAGIQADLKTMSAFGVYGMSAITSLTAQNTTGVYQILDVTPEFLASQLDCIFTDIRPHGVKIGMVSRKELIIVIGEKLREYQADHIVLDPVMVSTSGRRLLEEDAADTLKACLFPLAAVITPNIPEAQVLTGLKIQGSGDMETAAGLIGEQYGVAVLIKGGHQIHEANDVLYQNGTYTWFTGVRVSTQNTHGTGCTLSSAIACGLAKGESLEESIRQAKEYLTKALGTGLNLGKGSGPLNHCVGTEMPHQK